ncbi:MAG: alanine--tRNA ligase-related protein [Candidatus Berkelbacteria bacterium]|nr:alanine--tRNA ligase-related protein [Candidatus Berkelbacteria bacterium]
MISSELREKFLSFFEGKGHKIMPSSSLLPENDPSVLFTTAGMQQFKRYYLFPDEAPATRIVTCQKCVRTGDIDEVGDETHLTFFEMLGNFSFGYKAVKSEKLKGESSPRSSSGPYFKEEAIQWAWEFLIKELQIDKSRIFATYFKGENGVPADEESLKILQEIEGLSKIEPQGFDDNFWSLGTENSPGGPTVEFYIYPEQSRGVDGVEIWNLVFNEFVLKNGRYELSELKGIDTGLGLERLAAMMQGKSDVYQTDLFAPIIQKIEELSGKKYLSPSRHPELDSGSSKLPNQNATVNTQSFRIIADHIKSAFYMINDGVEPSNKGQGYILRRLIRRAVVKGKQLGINENFTSLLSSVISTGFGSGTQTYSIAEKSACHPDLAEGSNSDLSASARDDTGSKLETEENKFRKTLISGLKIISLQNSFDGKTIFDLYQTYGIPVEITLEEAKRRNKDISDASLEEFRKLVGEHQEKSRTASAGMFKGGLADNKIETTRLHTIAHLLLAALRHILGEEIEQKGSNITEERLRFDFNYPEKLSDEQLKKIEDLVNIKIEEALPITMQELSLDEAKKSGATGSFHDRYGSSVRVFTVGDPAEPFSREICGGPHVKNTSELGHFKITKEESSSAGIRRIKAILE